MDAVGVRPGSSLVGTLAGAYRRTVRDGHLVVSSAQVLRRGVMQVFSELDGFPLPWSRDWRQGPEPVDDEPPPHRSSLFPEFDQQVELFAEGALREATHDGGPGEAVFSGLVRHAVYEAVHEASRRDGVPAGVRHLLAAMYAVPGNAAGRLAEQMWVPGHGDDRLLSRQSPRYRAGDSPPNWAPGMLKALGVLPTTMPAVPRVLWNAVVTTGGYFLLRRPFRRHGTRYGHVIPTIVEREAALQAIRLGRTRTGTVEVLLSILDLHEQLHAAGVDLPEPVAQHNTAGQILRTQGVTLLAATVAAARSPDTPQVVAEPAAVGSPSRLRASRPAPPLDPDAESALRAASMAARESGHPFAGTTHLLAGILRDRDGPAARLLRSLGADPEAILEQTSVRPD